MIVGVGIGLLVWTVISILTRGFDAVIDGLKREALGWILLTIFLFALIAAGGISLAIMFTSLYSH